MLKKIIGTVFYGLILQRREFRHRKTWNMLKVRETNKAGVIRFKTNQPITVILEAVLTVLIVIYAIYNEKSSNIKCKITVSLEYYRTYS